VLDGKDSLPLLEHTGSTTFPGSLKKDRPLSEKKFDVSSSTCLVLDTAGLHLVCEDLGTGLLSLGLVDVFHKDTLVLEDVTLGFLVQGVVPILLSTHVAG